MRPDLAIVTASDSRFLPAACCQLLSVAENLPSRDAVQLFLVAFHLEADDLKQAKSFFESRGLTVQILVPDLDGITAYPTKKNYPSATYIRLWLDGIFDARWHRIIYFDADTRVCAPLGPLLEVNLAGMPLGAVHDSILYVTGNMPSRRLVLGLDAGAPYFNAGVLMFDWPLTIASEILAMTRRFITQYPERCKYDQDALNVVFREAWTPLDPRWNSTHLYSMFGRRLKPYVIHYTSTKPWSRWRLPIWREAAQWYREKLRDSPWADFVEPQAPWDAMRIRADLIDKRYRPILRDKISEYAPFLLDWLGKERSSTRVSWMPRKRSDVELMAQALIAESEGQLRLPSPPEAILDNRSPAPDSSARCQAAK